MDKKLMKIMPIIFILVLIASIVESLWEDMPSQLSTGIVYTETMVATLILELLIFYYDYKKNKSAVSIIGLMGIALYIIISLVYLIMSKTAAKNVDIDSLQSYIKTTRIILNIEQITSYIVSMLKYFSMVNIMSHKTNDQIVSMSQIGVYLSAFAYYMINIVLIFITENVPKFVNIISKNSYRLINIFLFTFVIYQYFAEEDLKIAEATEEKVKELTKNQAFQPNGPRFRNPALEAQQARLAQQQNSVSPQPQYNQMTPSQFQQPPSNHQTMPQQQMMNNQILNQPPIGNQPQSTNSQMDNNAPMNHL